MEEARELVLSILLLSGAEMNWTVLGEASMSTESLSDRLSRESACLQEFRAFLICKGAMGK